MAKPPKNPNACTNCHRLPPEGLGTRIFKGNVVSYRQCFVCRSKKLAYAKTTAGREAQTRANQNDLGKLRAKTYRTSKLGKATRSEYKKTDRCKKLDAKYAKSAKGKETKRAWRASANGQKSRKKTYDQLKSDPGAYLWHKMQCKIRKMILTSVTSKTVTEYSEFSTNEDVKAHFSGLLAPGMSMSNSGNDTADERKWHIGHRIPKAMYDHRNPCDSRRCWSKANLFPQWGKENMHLKVRLPDDEALLKLRCVWPISWNDELPDVDRRREFEIRALGR